MQKIGEVGRAVLRADWAYRPSVMGERKLIGDKVCKYLHISPRTLQNLLDTRPIPFTVIGGQNIICPESDVRKTPSTICGMSRSRSNAGRLTTDK